MNEIDVVLDLRKWRVDVTGPNELVVLWQQIESELARKPLPRGGACRVLPDTDHETTVLVLSSVPTLHAGAAFRIQGLIERPLIRRACRLCAAAGVTSLGAFQCQTCRSGGVQHGVCARHVCVLNGAYSRRRLLVSCVEHAPRCQDCSSSAEFWCWGPDCRGDKAWCGIHRRSHQNSLDIGYCPSCFEAAFPQCAIAGCREPGVSVCEYMDGTVGQACGLKLCNRHVARWQVFGYEKIGLARCMRHRQVSALSDHDVIFQVVAGTAWRHLYKGHRDGTRYFLPTLGSVKNILIKGRNKFYDEAAALALYEGLVRTLQSDSRVDPLRQKMKELLERASEGWRKRVDDADARRAQGEKYFSALKAVLQQRGERELAQAIAMSDFIPNFVRGNPPTPGLFVRVPEALKPRFIGRKGSNIQAYGAAIGCKLLTEREERR